MPSANDAKKPRSQYAKAIQRHGSSASWRMGVTARQSPVMMTLAALALLVPLAPFAEGHVESYAQSRALQAGPYLLFFEPRPVPPFANHTASMVVQVSDADTGGLLTRVPITLVVAGPGGFTERKPMESDGTGYLVASVTLPLAGNYSARMLVRDESTNETFGADTEFEVFPDLPVRIRPVDQALDVITDTRTPIAFEVVDPITLARKDTLTDLTVRVEHWSDDHATFLGEEMTPAVKAGPGLWRIEPIFKEPGMYHLRFASDAGGFTYADVPLLHVYAITPEAAGTSERESPSLGVVAIAALALALALARRRR